MISNLTYLYLLSPLHTGGTTQEGNLLGIARESHTDLPYIPSSTIRGRIRASTEVDKALQYRLFGTELSSAAQLEQGAIWIGDASILWLPIPSLSHGVIWISCPLLLQRWARLNRIEGAIPAEYSTNLPTQRPVYLKDAILKSSELKSWTSWETFLPQTVQAQTISIQRVLVLPDQHCATLIQMSLWRQVKIKLDAHKTVEGGFRYEEAIPPDTLMYFPWGVTSQANGTAQQARVDFEELLVSQSIVQIGGQESLGRGFVQQWLANSGSN
ncbi:type III-B CRISPR module RAMP protein Cmr4 [Trichocoleus sp. FACHB-591]|uniref:type III-B CRISPR module RAMP protein Cmr4 n=1 Tax=Trichocoleus sp. FACHB-591 TaxID=2692872 RepID=UPI00168495DC|nr:type III-B CRISPR module RAMP protein Cmr4 [Trichocoleus sp. FACHB-591]MBD2097718.1 type III-B CRISPR module RAMP protein Cmr4 [Trichocoleus sp. FACHB-591]